MLTKVTASNMVKHLVEISKLKEPITTVFVGIPGIGKTFSVMEAARLTGRFYYPISLSHYEQYDIKGFPNIQGDYVRWVPPELVEVILKHKGNLIVHIDEYTLTRREVQDALLDLLQFKRIDDRVLPSNTMFVLTGNKGGIDGTAARAISSAITGGRAEIFEVKKPTIKEYLDYETLDLTLRKFLLKVGINGLVQSPDPSDSYAPWTCPRSFSILNSIVRDFKLDLSKATDVTVMLRHAKGLLSTNTILLLEDFFDDMLLNVTGLMKLYERDWGSYAKADSFKKSEALSEISDRFMELYSALDTSGSVDKAKYISDLQKFISVLTRNEKDSEIIYSFVFPFGDLDIDIGESVYVNKKTIASIYDELMKKKYAKDRK